MFTPTIDAVQQTEMIETLYLRLKGARQSMWGAESQRGKVLCELAG